MSEQNKVMDVEMGNAPLPSKDGTEMSKPNVEDLMHLFTQMNALLKRDMDERRKAEDAPPPTDASAKQDYHIMIAADFAYWWSPLTWYSRIRQSSFAHLLHGHNINTDEIDTVVNTLALVNALVLTIPFSVIMSLGFDYWDEVTTLANGCNPSQQISYDFILNGFRNDFITVIYGSIMALILVIIYYILRPRVDDALFHRWWRTSGNKMFLVLCVLTVSGIVGLLTLSTHVLKYSLVRRESFCNFPNVVPSQVAYSMLAFLVFFALVILV